MRNPWPSRELQAQRKPRPRAAGETRSRDPVTYVIWTGCAIIFSLSDWSEQPMWLVKIFKEACNAIHNVTIFKWATSPNDIARIYSSVYSTRKNPQVLLKVVFGDAQYKTTCKLYRWARFWHVFTSSGPMREHFVVWCVAYYSFLYQVQITTQRAEISQYF